MELSPKASQNNVAGSPIVGTVMSVDPQDGTAQISMSGSAQISVGDTAQFPSGPIWVAPHTGMGTGGGYLPPGQGMTTDKVYIHQEDLIGPNQNGDIYPGDLVSHLGAIANVMDSTDQHLANLLSEFLKHVNPQDEGMLQLMLDERARMHNDELVVNAVNAELSFEECVVRVEKLKLTHQFEECEGVWKSKPILKIALRTVTIMDLGDEK